MNMLDFLHEKNVREQEADLAEFRAMKNSDDPGLAYVNADMSEGNLVDSEVFDDLAYLHRISICLRTLSRVISNESRSTFLVGYTTYLTARDKLSIAERKTACETIFTASICYKHLLAVWDNYDAFSRKEWEPPDAAWEMLSYVDIDGKIIEWKEK